MNCSAPRHLPLVAMALGVVACASSNDAPTSAAQRTTYEGVFATGSRGGIVQLVSGTPATGTLRMTGGSTVALVGSYNEASGAFAVSGGGYAITASTENVRQVKGALNGTTASTTGVLTAYALDGTAQTKVCGTFSGAMSGTLNAVVSGTSISAVAVDANGNGMTANGTLTGSSMSFEWKPIGNIPAGVTGSATGALTGPTSGAGTWQMSNGMRGTWTAAGC